MEFYVKKAKKKNKLNQQNLIPLNTIHYSSTLPFFGFSKKSMATPLHLTTSPSSFTLTPPKKQPTTNLPHLHLTCHPHPPQCFHLSTTANSYKVIVEHHGQTTELEVDPDETILSKALDSGLDVPHDCKLGVCMTCPAKLLSGSVDQTEGMLSDDVIESGYSLLCVSYPKSDCHVRIIPEEELLSLQLATSND